MIYVNQKQLDQVEYIIEQSSRGHHVLFDIDTIRKVYSRGAIALAEDDSEVVTETEEETAEKHIENIILQPTLVAKKAYLENLSDETFDRVVKTYFAIVENNIFEDLEYCQ